MPRTGAPRRRLLYRAGASSGNRQDSTLFDDDDTTNLSSIMPRPRRVLPEARGGDGSAAFEPGPIPSSPHAEGRAARALLEEARTTLAEVLGWRHDVIFTSGASEAIEIAAARAKHHRAGAMARPNMPIVPHAMGERVRRSSRSMPTA